MSENTHNDEQDRNDEHYDLENITLSNDEWAQRYHALQAEYAEAVNQIYQGQKRRRAEAVYEYRLVHTKNNRTIGTPSLNLHAVLNEARLLFGDELEDGTVVVQTRETHPWKTLTQADVEVVEGT